MPSQIVGLQIIINHVILAFGLPLSRPDSQIRTVGLQQYVKMPLLQLLLVSDLPFPYPHSQIRTVGLNQRSILNMLFVNNLHEISKPDRCRTKASYHVHSCIYHL